MSISLNRTQIIILFLLLCGVVTLGTIILWPREPASEDSVQTLVESVQTGFDETVEQTDTREEISLDLSFEEKIALAPDPEEEEEGDSLDFESFRYRSTLESDFIRLDAPLEDFGVYAPRATGTYEQYIVNRFGDGTEIYVIPEEEKDFRDFVPLLKRPSQTLPVYYSYLAKDDVHIYLGDNITNVFSVRVQEREYWVSLILEPSGYHDGLYVSLPYFENLTQIPDLFLEAQDGYVNGRFLYLTLFEEGGLSGPVERPVRLDIERLLNAPTGTDYNELFEDV